MNQQVTFIESQFPVSKVSKESYKERMANYSQTLTGLGKWWGRKPLVLVRATLLGLLLPATDNPEKDREIFLKLMTMDEDGLWQRYLAKGSSLSAQKVYEILTDEDHHERMLKALQKYGQGLTGSLGFSDQQNAQQNLAQLWQDFFKIEKGKVSWQKFSKESGDKIKLALSRIAFAALYYDEKIEYCVRPEQIEGPSPEAWREINAHLNTSAQNLQELVAELGRRRFGHVPRVGDAFCGGGSIPFEAARLGCDVYASDLNPVAALLTWAAIHIVGGGPQVADEVRAAQQEIYDAVNRQVSEWGIEHNEQGHRADAYLYCVEVKDPETGWRVPLAPSWVIGEKTRTVAILEPDEKNKRYHIRIKMNASDSEMKAAKQGTVRGSYVVHPKNPNPLPMALIRRENEGGLRLWENDDLVPRPDDVFQERLYCIRYVVPPLSERIREFATLTHVKDHPWQKLELGTIDKKTAKLVQKKTGVDVTNLTVVLERGVVARLLSDQSPVIAAALELLPDLLAHPGEVCLDPTAKNKDKIVNFVKFYDRYRVAAAFSVHQGELKLAQVSVQPEQESGTLGFAGSAPDAAAFTALCRRITEKYKDKETRYYAEVTAADLAREAKVLALLKERFADWQAKGFLPARKIEPGDKTDEPIRNRGWTHWHHLFNPRQLLVNGLLMKVNEIRGFNIALMLSIGKCLDYNAKLTRWTVAAGSEKTDNVFSNQALNTLSNYGVRTLVSSKDNFMFSYNYTKYKIKVDFFIETKTADILNNTNDLWITDPPYADAVNYHELSEFFLAWYEKHLPQYFPDWATDSRRSLAIKGSDETFRRSMVAAYRNLTQHMPDNGLQVVMFTHQNAAVWADLAVILWASGLQVTAAWTIATETTSALKDGNYVQGTVLLVLRKNTSDETGFLFQMVPRIEDEVRNQVALMEKIEDKEEPNFSDTDYQLAAYAAALRVITSYRQIEDIDLERELSRTGNTKSPLQEIIENARDVAASIRIPEGIDHGTWRNLSPAERFYLYGLSFEAKGETRLGAYTEMARNYGVRDYDDLMGSVSANAARVKTAAEFGKNQLGGDGFAQSTLRHLLYGIYRANKDENPESGRNYLKSELGSQYWANRQSMVNLLRYLGRFEHSIRHREPECKMAALLAGLLENDSG